MMKKTTIYFLFALVALASLLGFTSSEQDDAKRNDILIDIVSQGLQRNHFLDLAIDDNFSERVFSIYIDHLDFNKRFFYQKDIEELSFFETKIDDEIENRRFGFLNRSVEILNERITESKEIYEEILSKPFDFTIKEDFETDTEKRGFPANKAEMKEVWRKMLKYQTLARLDTKLKEQEKTIEDNQSNELNADSVPEVKTFEELEKECREGVLKMMNDYFHQLEKLEWDDRRSIYLNAITGAFDPHSNFFPPKDKENFDIGMTGQFEGIGATLTSKDGYITVQRIVAGSASWKQGELEEEDKILKVAQGEEEPVSVVDMRLDKAVELIRGPKESEVRLTVQKIDGSIVVIPIIRDVVILEETYAKSVVLEYKNKVGYIKLPKFYADFNLSGARSCSEDMKEEIAKLKEEKVDGIIIDLRDNGGGSLQDVVKIAGLFIEKGPVVQVKARDREPYIFEDNNQKIAYDGPLAIMVNTFSASASEILAAAMQDYDRAVIIGSPSTYGKGTVQKVLDFDRIIPASMDDLKPLGAMKVTMQKFYRINGSTTQLQGVIPDIILPDNYAYLDIGEKDLEFPLISDSIQSANYQVWDNSWDKTIDKLQKQSKKRVVGNKVFGGIDENAKRLKKRSEESSITLNLEEYRAFNKELLEQGKKYKELLKDSTGLGIITLKADLVEAQKDSLSDVRKKWHKELKMDAHLFEAVNILNDLL